MTVTAPEHQAEAPAPESSGLVQRPWLVVAVREIVVKLRDRNFIISTIITLVMVAGAIGLSAFFSSRATDYTVGVVDDDGARIVESAEVAAGTGDPPDTITATEYDDAAAARTGVENGDIDVALLPGDDGWTLVGLSEVSSTLEMLLTDAVAADVLEQNAQAAGTSTAELTAGSQVSTELLEGDTDNVLLQRVVGFAFAFLFYIAAIMFGMTIATSVLEEKQNRVVEILATAVPIRQLLLGKVVGNSVLALGQITLTAAVGLIGLNFTDLVPDVGFILGAAGWFVVFFIVGFFALAAVFGVLGAMASRQEDLNSSTGPVLMVIMVATFVGIFATGTALTVASFVPIMSTVAMPIRLLGGDVAIWQPIVALALNALGAYLLVRLADRVYQRAVLQGGTALSWRQALRLEA